MLTSIVLSIFSDCVLFYHAFQAKVLKPILTHTFLALVPVGLGHGVYRKLYRLTLLRQPLNTNTFVVLAQNGQILFIHLYWTN